MKHCRIPLAGLLALAACASDARGCSAAQTDEIEYSQLIPIRDQWRIELDAAFDPSVISQLAIGGTTVNDNFANRGDVIVQFDGAPGRIVVELRRFTMTHEDRDPDEALEPLGLWAYDASDGVALPNELPESTCTEQWHPGCALRVFHYGQAQPVRSGADIKVTLPADYRGHLDVETQDNVADDTYPVRGDVCMLGLPGTATVALESGRAWLSLAADIQVAPACTAAQRSACQEGSSPWTVQCPCRATPVHNPPLGASRIHASGMADIVASVPPDLWMTLAASGNNHAACAPHCEVTLEGFGAVAATNTGTVSAVVNEPEGIQDSEGYWIDVATYGCGPVVSLDDPEAWRPDPSALTTAVRGHVEICAGCLDDVACADLVP